MELIDTERIRRLRQQRGWDQKELAMQAGINPSVISRLERRLQADFHLSIIKAIADVLGVTIDSLLLDTTSVNKGQNLIPELQTIIAELTSQPATVQQQTARMLRAYLSLINSE